MRAYLFLGKGSGRGLGPGILEFFGPHMALAYRLDVGPKNSRIPGPNPRVRRSYSLKAKISENVGIFVLALKRKKSVFFRFVRMEVKHSKQQKNESELSQKRKEKRKSAPSSLKGIIIFQVQ
jgi:hypothetical protein